MATVISGNKIKLNNGQIITASTGGWYDGQQFWNGTLSDPGVINSQSDQQGAGQAVSKEVVNQTNPSNWDYLQKQNPSLASSGSSGSTPNWSSTSGFSPPSTSVTGAELSGMFNNTASTLNLPELYQSLYNSSGIAGLESDYAAKQQAYNQAQAQINDNPFLSEASRVGRVQKLTMDYNNNIAALQNQIATKKADVEMQLNLKTKQFDIDSQAAQQALSQFNTLLEMGALDNASGEDIANITRSTGLSSSAIQSAINARKAANQKQRETQVISYDDGTNQGYAVIDSTTGEIINKQVISASKSADSGGSGGSGGGGTQGLSNSQYQKAAGQANKLLKATNDKWVDLKEYKKIVNQLMANMGIDMNTADNIVTIQMKAIGYKRYKW